MSPHYGAKPGRRAWALWTLHSLLKYPKDKNIKCKHDKYTLSGEGNPISGQIPLIKYHSNDIISVLLVAIILISPMMLLSLLQLSMLNDYI